MARVSRRCWPLRQSTPLARHAVRLGVIAAALSLAVGSISHLVMVGMRRGIQLETKGRNVQRRSHQELAEKTEATVHLPDPDAALRVGADTYPRALAKVMRLCLRERPRFMTMSAGHDAGFRVVQASAYASRKLAANGNADGADCEAASMLVTIQPEAVQLRGVHCIRRTCTLRQLAPSGDEDVLFVSRRTNVGKLAGAVKARVAEHGVILRAVGSLSSSQAEKAIMLASRYFEDDGLPTALVYAPITLHSYGLKCMDFLVATRT